MPSSLTNGYPVRLAILLPPTCVGLRYGHLNIYLSSFSRQREFIGFVTSFHSPSSPRVMLNTNFAILTPHDLATTIHHRVPTILLCHCIDSLAAIGGTGISTCCPSPTTFVLGLGPDLPWEDNPSPGNLGHSTAKFLTLLSLLMPAFSLVCSPPPLTIWLQPHIHCSSTACNYLQAPSFGSKF